MTMTMNEQMVRDLSLYLKPDRIEELIRYGQRDFEEMGVVDQIIDFFDGDDLIRRCYHFSKTSDEYYGRLLDGRRASEDGTLNELLKLDTLTTSRRDF
ncbi:hypothetical protein AGMMS49960_05590 [Betaproteobacteria bacterium]|nr:hypothetical protein AGMMS49543_25170 [Betaproteobacteria bacterium]GHT99676.1 hypothetical protein AGMMS49960_05590 [Betaproteobacteria bacterium]GHU22942.1 hypothetical protein AGMMS50243_23480 [Betaproteobacteria bacterium]